jgi:hypothetical protein
MTNNSSPTSVKDYVDKAAAWDAIAKKNEQITTLVKALQGLLDRYTGLVNCGDCGFWDPEKEGEVIAARSALANLENQS